MSHVNAAALEAHASQDTPQSAHQDMSAARLDRLPVGRFHYRIMAIIGAGLFVDGFEVILASTVLGALQKIGWTNLHLTSMFTSATFLGLMIGGWMAGMVGDHFGRKKSYQLNLLIFGGAALGAVFAPNMQVLIGLRFIMGIGLGAELVLGYSTLAEFVPPKMRGRLSAGMALVTQAGGFTASVSSAWVIPHLGWRYMFLFAGVGAGAVWLLRRFMPESPRWLESQGRHVEAAAVLDRIETYVFKKKPVVTSEAEIGNSASEWKQEKSEKPKVWVLFSPKYLRSTLIAILVMVTMQISLYGLMTWLPTFFVSMGYSMADALRWNAYIAFGQPIGGVIALLLVDRVGRKKMLSIAALTAVVASVFFVTATLETPPLLITVGLVFATVTSLLIVVGQGIYLSELFPTQIRARGAGLSSSVSRLLSVGVQALVPVIFSTYRMSGVLLAVDAALVIFALCIMVFGVETKMKSLEAISD